MQCFEGGQNYLALNLCCYVTAVNQRTQVCKRSLHTGYLITVYYVKMSYYMF